MAASHWLRAAALAAAAIGLDGHNADEEGHEPARAYAPNTRPHRSSSIRAPPVSQGQHRGAGSLRGGGGPLCASNPGPPVREAGTRRRKNEAGTPPRCPADSARDTQTTPKRHAASLSASPTTRRRSHCPAAAAALSFHSAQNGGRFHLWPEREGSGRARGRRGGQGGAR